ncbi:MAG: 3-oxocholest-4-en-26-oate---CoA ligase [Actinomycetota bacterium]|nr:3-oxocholest-4-en-26-oate---CoA ligase [Actinomycetota bacterium]
MHFNLADLWERVADTVPDHDAVVDGERRFTYAELDERADRLAHTLAAQGIGPGEHVAVYLYNSVEYLETMLAAFKLRAVPINVNYRYVEDELRYLFTDCDARAVVFHEEFAPKLCAIRSSLPLLRTFIAVGTGAGATTAISARPDGEAHADATGNTGNIAASGDTGDGLGCIDYEAALRDAPQGRAGTDRSGDDLYILYTGGTTGMPKGVMWRHEDVFFGAMGGGGGGGPAITTPEQIAERCLVPRTRCVPACPFMHGTAHWMAFSTLFLGGTVIIPTEHTLAPVELWQLIAREQANFLVIVGDAFARPLLDALEPDAQPNAAGVDLSSCRVILSGGAILSPTLKRALVERLPGVLVVDGYGASETGGQGQSVTVAGAPIASAPRFSVNDETRVLGPDFQPLPAGVVGLLARRGHIPLGYYKDPEKTAATFPIVDGVRWSVPGDHAVVEDDGTITLLGRGSVSINTGGEKVYPEEVESALKSFDAIFDAVVVGVPDARFGERVVAVVQVRPGESPALAVIQEHLRSQLAGYKVPRGMVQVDQIVRSPSGKPDYRWAKATAIDGLEKPPA